MAITINQDPTFPNVSYTNLMYAVSSNEVSNPQFQYVMDIRSGSGGGPVLARIRQYPNPAGSAIFDPSRIINDYLEYDTSFSETDFWYPQDTKPDIQRFTMEFGEEYASSPSSSVVLYDGNGNPGEPNVTTNSPQGDLVFPGTVDPNNGESYNWLESGSLTLLTDRPSDVPVDMTQDYYTITAHNGHLTEPARLYLVYKDENNNYIGGASLYCPPEYFVSANIGYNETIIGGGPHYGVEVYLQSINTPANQSRTLELNYSPVNCNWDRINFAFINKDGQWDYYGMNLPVSKTTDIQRKEIRKPFADYSSGTSPYNLQSRGKEYYNSSYDDKLSVYTDWLNQEQAEWLSQLIESPEVYVQEGTKMIPIIITNSSYTHNTNKAAQKTFQYQIQYQYSNQRPSR